MGGLFAILWQDGTMRTFVLTFILCFSFVSQASEMVGAISAGMGGTGRAAVESNESVFLNPASIALFDRFYAGAGYQSGFLSQDISRNTYSIVLSDGTPTALLPGSFAYRKHNINAQGQRFQENEYKVGVGYRVSPRISVGLGYSYLDAEGPAGQRHNQSNGDIGVLLGLMPNWGLSLNAENLIKPDQNKPSALVRPSRVALGTQFLYEQYLTFRYEALMPLHVENTDKLGHRIGLSAMMKGFFQLNLGFSVDDHLEQNWSSIGVAWRGPRLKFAYSYQNEDRQGLGARHLVDLWMDL